MSIQQTNEQSGKREKSDKRPLVAFVASKLTFALDLAVVVRAIPACEIWRPRGAIRHAVGMMRFEGSAVPILDPVSLIQEGSGTRVSPASRFLLARPRGRVVGFVCDAVLGVRLIAAEAFESAARMGMGMSRLRDVAAGDEGLIHIFDPEKIFAADDEAAFDAALAEHPR